MSGGEKLYWIGNIAKTRIISEILRDNPGPQRVDVFDYGCGDGGDWPRILADHPHIVLSGYEPYGPMAETARRRLYGLNARILSDAEFATLNDSADIVVSFSVFEHVIARPEFLAHARRILRPDGLFYLNYDDGHFRYVLNLAEPRLWIVAVRSALLTLISGVTGRLNRVERYQRRVLASEASKLIYDAGLRMQRCDYHNVESLKELAKTIPDEQAQEFSASWLAFEIELNRKFLFYGHPRFGDDANLWRVTTSRTLLLRHSRS